MQITLAWNGPLKVGKFPQEKSALDDLYVPGVYLRVRQYGERTVSYVGQSKHVIWRIAEHLTNMLGLNYALRDDKGQLSYEPTFYDRFQRFNSIDEAVAESLAEVKRMEFYYALCDEDVGFTDQHLNLVESSLKGRIEFRVREHVQGLSCENVQGIPNDPFEDPIVIVSDTSALKGEAIDVVDRVVGTEPIYIPESAIGSIDG